MTEVKLNGEQEKAAKAELKPVLVLAGPGAGKSFTMHGRIENLVNEKGMDQNKIYMMAFNRKMSDKMQSELHEKNIGGVKVSTIHALAYAICKDDGYKLGLGKLLLINEEEAKASLGGALLKVSTGEKKDFCLKDVADAKKKYVKSISDFIEMDIVDLINKAVACEDKLEGFLCAYYAEQRVRNRVDFDDYLALATYMLTNDMTVREKWHKKIEYLLVDEVQDIDSLQYDFVKALLANRNNIMVVGDSDQCIYSFRGAANEILQSFCEEFTDVIFCPLTNNYRSTATIVNAATRFLRNNGSKSGLKMYSMQGAGEVIEYKSYANPYEEAVQIAKQILAYNGKGVPFSKMAVLVREKKAINVIKEKLTQKHIDVVTNKPVTVLEDGLIYKYFKAAILQDDESILETINKPVRKVKVSELKKFCSQRKCSIAEGIKKFAEKDKFKDTDIADYFSIISGIQKAEKLQQYDMLDLVRCVANRVRHKMLSAGEKESFSLFEDCVVRYQATSYGDRSFANFFEHINLQGPILELVGNRGVAVMTMHASKGQEYDYVWLPSLNESIVPCEGLETAEEYEEERRVFGVALTRAKKKIYLSSVDTDLRGRNLPLSSFLAEMGIENIHAMDWESQNVLETLSEWQPKANHRLEFRYQSGSFVKTPKGIGMIILNKNDGSSVMVQVGDHIYPFQVEDVCSIVYEEEM